MAKVQTIFLVSLGLVCLVQSASTRGNRCQTPPLAPQKIERVIGVCQEEIKIAILSEALNVLQPDSVVKPARRLRRDAFSDDEKKIAGCLLQCVYRKVKAVDSNGFPTAQGLVNLYTEGITEQGYLLASYQAVQQCLAKAEQTHLSNAFRQNDSSKNCDVAFDVFECVSDKIGEYCGHTP